MSFFRMLCVLAAVALPACSNYQARWQSARAVKGDALEGAYEGRWSSTRYEGAGGKLWCILKKTGQREYHADFRATWHGVFASEHGVTLRMGRGGAFRGETDIRMWIGSGRYACTGRVKDGVLSADYDATYDTGRLEMRKSAAP